MSETYIIKRKVLFGDCDPGGIVYTPRISHFVVESILEFLSYRLGGKAERKMIEMGILPPARSMSMEFIKPMTWDDELDIHVTVKELRNSAVVFSVTADVKGDVTFKAELTQVCVSLENKRPIEIPKRLREVLQSE